MESKRFTAAGAATLAGLLFISILTVSARGRWAVSLLQTGVFGLGIVWLLRFMWKPTAVVLHAVLIPAAAAVGWILLQLLWRQTVNRFETWNAILFWGANLVALFLAMQFFAEPRRREAFLNAALWFASVLSVISTIQLLCGEARIFWLFPSGYQDQVIGPFVYRNHYAAFIELVLPIAVAKAVSDPQSDKAALYGAMAGLMFASVIATASRAGSILTAFEIVAVTAIGLRRQQGPVRQRSAVFARIAVAAVLFTALLGADRLWRRFELSDPFVYRREMFHSSVAMVSERPWFGFGLGTWPAVYPAYATIDAGVFMNHAHDDWAEWTAEGGAPFFLVLLAIALWTARAGIRTLWGFGVPIVFLHAAVDYPFQKQALAAWVFTFIGCMAASARLASCGARANSHRIKSGGLHV